MMGLGDPDTLVALVGVLTSLVSMIGTLWVWLSDLHRRRSDRQRLANVFGELVRDLAEHRALADAGPHEGAHPRKPLGKPRLPR